GADEIAGVLFAQRAPDDRILLERVERLVERAGKKLDAVRAKLLRRHLVEVPVVGLAGVELAGHAVEPRGESDGGGEVRGRGAVDRADLDPSGPRNADHPRPVAPAVG